MTNNKKLKKEHYSTWGHEEVET